jgi:sugar transferase (PEP-CTERM/EpsH1 system associated)
MKNLLFLVHRIPYPPNKGDKIRSYHFLKGLAEHYNIHLVTFIDDPEDWQYVGKIEALTDSSLLVKLTASFSKLKSLRGLLTNKALSLPYYQSNKVQSWVDKTIQENNIEKVFIYSSAMAQYVDKYDNLDITIDFVDVDSDKWSQYAQKATWPMNWVYRREAKLLLDYDKHIARHAKVSAFVSEAESLLFKGLFGGNTEYITYVNNGVDTVFFDPYLQYKNPYMSDGNIVFTGAMDYWANIDAVLWFAEQVFPLIKQQNSQAQFYIVGSNPAKEVLQLATREGVSVIGRVDDIRAYIFFANVIVTPLLIARGIQNKILEAMAMGKRIVATPQAIEGITITDQEVTVVEKSVDFAAQVVTDLNNTSTEYCSVVNRDFVTKHYSWSASLKRLTQIIESD